MVSVLCAQARDVKLELHTGVALRNGLTRTEIEEIVLTVAAYAGYPAAMAASRHVDAALRQAEGVEQLSERSAPASKSDAERDRDAAEVYRAVSGGRGGDDPEKDLRFLTDRLGGVGELAYRWAFGEVWARPELARRDRSLSVIAILTSLGAENELAVHIPTGIRNGLTPEGSRRPSPTSPSTAASPERSKPSAWPKRRSPTSAGDRAPDHRRGERWADQKDTRTPTRYD